MKNKANYKLVASDLDGTLLGSNQRVSRENLAAIAELNELGVSFVPVTGRCIYEITDDITGCPNIKYIITSDGASVWDNEKGCVCLEKYIPNDMVDAIISEAEKYTVYPLAHEGGTCFYDNVRHIEETLDECHVNRYFRQLIAEKDVPLDHFNDHMKTSGRVEMFCIFFAYESELRSFRENLLKTGKLEIAQSDKHNLEIYSKEAGKGNTLLSLASKLNIQRSEVIAVGDSTNDLSMIQAAGLGLAMENACEELKAEADETICHFSEHNVRYILENYIKRDSV